MANYSGRTAMRKIRALLLAVAMGIMTAAMPFGAGFARAETSQKAPPSLIAAVQVDLKDRDDLKDVLRDRGLTLKQCVFLERLHHGQPQQAWFAWLPCMAGANNGEFYLYARSGDGWRQILHGFGQFWQVCAKADPPCPAPWSKRRSGSAHGWPDLAVWVHGSVNEGGQFLYRFDGHVYTMVACRLEHAAALEPTHRLVHREKFASEPTYSPCPQQ
jgi:hypothetical protein